MPTERVPGKSSTRRYTPAEKEQAVRVVHQLRWESSRARRPLVGALVQRGTSSRLLRRHPPPQSSKQPSMLTNNPELGNQYPESPSDPGRFSRATYTRTKEVRHLMAAYDLGQDKIYGHIKMKTNRRTFLEFCRYLRTLCPQSVRIAIAVMDNFSPHLSTKKDTTVGDGPRPTRSELDYGPTDASWLNRIEAQFQALR
jgi:DDE superfamily endonuclease